MVKLTDDEFEGAVQDALDSIPDDLFDELENVLFCVEDEPAYEEDEFDELGEDAVFSDEGDLLGLYEGVNLYDRGDSYGAGDELPDTITIFKGPHERLEGSKAHVLEEVRKTVIHEVGHYFGMDEDQLDAIGYGEIDY